MARAYDTATPRTQPEGVQVAGIFDLLKLGQMLGRNFDDVADAARRGDPGAWFDNRVFMGIDNNPRVEVPDAFYGGDLPRFDTLRGLVEEGPTLQEYIRNAPAGDLLGDAAADYKVGMSPLPGYEAGINPPEYVDLRDGTRRLLQPGYLSINEAYAGQPNQIRRLLEHEGTHVAQDVLRPESGSGATQNFMLRLSRYLDDTGIIPNFSQETMNMLPVQQRDKTGLLQYIHAAGEAEARAAERAYLDEAFGARAPTREDYSRNQYGLPFRTDLMYNLTPEMRAAAEQHWRDVNPTAFNQR